VLQAVETAGKPCSTPAKALRADCRYSADEAIDAISRAAARREM
jgi:hypothetical protein